MPNVNGKKFPYTAKGIKAAMAASKKKKPKKKTKVSPLRCKIEEIRRDQKALLYKPVPQQFDEIDVYFYDRSENLIQERIGLKRIPGKTFC